MGLKVHEDGVKHVKSLENESTINLKGQIFIAPAMVSVEKQNPCESTHTLRLNIDSNKSSFMHGFCDLNTT